MSETSVEAGGSGFLTSEEAALMVGVSEATIRKWVEREYLQPLNPGRKPARFRERDVWECARARMSRSYRDRLWAAWTHIRGSE